MRLYIVRHAKAADLPSDTPMGASARRTPGGVPELDHRRPLTLRGRAQADYLARCIEGGARRPTLILSSDATRALDTATAMQKAARCELRIAPELSIDRPVSEALELIQAHEEVRDLMLVGHNPQMGELLSVLACGLPPQELTMRTGELVGLDIRAADSVGSARIVERCRLDDHMLADDSMAPAADLGARRPARTR